MSLAKSTVAPPKEFKTTKLSPSGISNRTYFTALNAAEIKVTVDLMLATSEDRILPYKDYRLRPNSLYIKVCDGLKFLCQYLDPENIYKNFRDRVKIAREEQGVTMRFIATGESLSLNNFPKIREKVESFIEDESGVKLHLTGISLAPESIVHINTFLQPVSDIYAFKITPNEILIIKK